MWLFVKWRSLFQCILRILPLYTEFLVPIDSAIKSLNVFTNIPKLDPFSSNLLVFVTVFVCLEACFLAKLK